MDTTTGYVYVVSGGDVIKTGIVKIGVTNNINTLRDRYTTYYGSNCKISCAEVTDAYITEQSIHNFMQHNCDEGVYTRVGTELYKCSITEAKDIIRAFTECKRLKTC